MIMDYNGYRIDVLWCEKDLGFQFSVYNEGGKEVSYSVTPFFYEENALIAAKKKVDAIIEGG